MSAKDLDGSAEIILYDSNENKYWVKPPDPENPVLSPEKINYRHGHVGWSK
jgi:hypothetical protein